jgi:hypothetical protein
MKRFCALLILSASVTLSSCGDSDTSQGTTFVLQGSASSAVLAWYQPALDALLARANAAAGSPTSAKLTVHSVWLSPNGDCTDAVLVADNGAAPVESDLFLEPDLIAGFPAAGTYECLILEMNDTIKFKADAAAVAANAGCDDVATEYTFDIYRDGEEDDGLWKDKDGVSIDASGSVEAPGTDVATIFISTNVAAVQAGAIGANANQAVVLAGAITVPSTATLFWDFTDLVESNAGNCWLEPATVGVR